jgi:TPR repeat protein
MAEPYEDAVAAFQKGDFAMALRLWRPLAAQGNTNAAYVLGMMYDDGMGVAPDSQAAVQWYRQAAEQGNAWAQYALGAKYTTGDGVALSYQEAAKWTALAAAQGHAGAQRSLGVMYANGRGVPQDYTEAVTWFRRAAEQGSTNAQANLGVMYEARARRAAGSRARPYVVQPGDGRRGRGQFEKRTDQPQQGRHGADAGRARPSAGDGAQVPGVGVQAVRLNGQGAHTPSPTERSEERV